MNIIDTMNMNQVMEIWNVFPPGMRRSQCQNQSALETNFVQLWAVWYRCGLVHSWLELGLQMQSIEMQQWS